MTVDDGFDDKDGSDEGDKCECGNIKLGVNISSGLRAHIQLSISLAKENGKWSQYTPNVYSLGACF